MINRPIRATHHCRHYSYQDGPCCAQGHPFMVGEAMRRCMPLKDGNQSTCQMREDYTDVERAEWQAHIKQKMLRLEEAISALPRPITLRTSGTVSCPNCGGALNYSRWVGGASVVCSTTPHCVGPARFNISKDADWPSPQEVGETS